MSGPYTKGKNGEPEDSRIWESDLTDEQEQFFNDYIEIRSLELALNEEKEKRAEHKKFKDLGMM